MDIVMWFERPKKNMNVQRYFPEYVNIAIFDDNKNKRGEYEFRLKISPTAADIDSAIIQGFEPVIKIIKAYQKCNLYISSPEDLNVMRFIVDRVEPKLLVGDFYLMKPFDWQFIYKGNPASKSPARRARLSKMTNIYKCNKFDNASNITVERDKNRVVVTNYSSADTKENKDEKVEAKDTTNKQSNNKKTSEVEKKFVSNRGIGKYHTLDCPWATMIKEENRVYMNEDELLPNLKPCTKCISNMNKKIKLTKKEPKTTEDNATPIIVEQKQTATEVEEDINKQNSTEVVKTAEVVEPVTEMVAEDNTEVSEVVTHPSVASTDKSSDNTSVKIPSDIGALGRQIIKICEAYEIYCAIYNTTAVILTAAGGWKFDYTDRPIKLYHQNYKSINGTKENSEYHLQSGDFYSPIDAIAYIIKHDSKRIKMMLKELE